MIEIVNPSHPDVVADRIAGALVDLAYKKEKNPKVAVEVLIGHGDCHIIIESSVNFENNEVDTIVHRIAGEDIKVDLKVVPQDEHLASNQENGIRTADNGIFKGCKASDEEKTLMDIAKYIYRKYPFDGKYIYDEEMSTLIVCQSNCDSKKLRDELTWTGIRNVIVNPLGDWTGGTDVDTGATNRKLGSQLGRAITGGGINGKDCSKADVSMNVYLHIIAQERNEYELPIVFAKCAIGDKEVEIEGRKVPYEIVTKEALEFIQHQLGGFEKMAEWGLLQKTEI